MTEPATNIETGTDNSQAAIEERIRIRAYELYEKRNGEGGDPESDWYRAETEINEGVLPAE